MAAAASVVRHGRALPAAASSSSRATLSSAVSGLHSVARALAGPSARIRSFITVTDDGKTVRDHLPTARGLYDPKLERDSCGVG